MRRILTQRNDTEAGDASTDADVDGVEHQSWFERLRQRRGVVSSLLILLGAVIAFACWLGFEGYGAKSNLEQAQASAVASKDALLQGNTEQAVRQADLAVIYAQGAQEATDSLPWRIAAAIPWLGSPFRTGGQIADVVADLTADVLRPAADVSTALTPDSLLVDGRLNVAVLRDEEPALTAMAAEAATIDAASAAIVDPAYVSMLSEARTQLQAQTAELSGILHNTALAARIAPAMMGADGPRTYFMGFQTNAEARGTGGLLGGFGVLQFDEGAASVDALAPNTELDKNFTPMDLGYEYSTNYGFADPTTDYRNSNMSSHFPYAAQIWKSLWEQQSGMQVDGVIALDPIALSYILDAVGPVTMDDGEVITTDNVVELTESTAYIRFPTDQVARKQYLQDIANKVVEKITGEIESPRKLLDALGRSAGERRIMVWSARPDEQVLLEQTPLAHAIPDDAAPYAEVIVNNLAGNKIDYYLRREIEYAADGCSADTRMSTVTFRLTNEVAAEPNLPDYVAGSAGVVRELPIELISGTALSSVRLLATSNAVLASATVNGERAVVFNGNELGHPAFEIQVAIPPGKTAEVVFRLSEPTAPGAPRVPVQPLVDAVVPRVSVPQC